MDNKDINLTDEETINLFVEGLMDEKGIKPESEQMRKDIFDDLKTKVMTELDRSLVSALPDDKLEELSKEAEEKGQLDPEVVAKAIEEAGVDVGEVAGVTMAKFRELYLGENQESGAAEGAEA
ncbi:hypothetical protein IKF40_01905 [Candidatus Saccharibacteria bacterium]|nr:hypothetical protein [Candidatus Saccharibacteria bacterium]